MTLTACGTSPSVVGTPNWGIITVGTGAATTCRLNYPTSSYDGFINPPACIATYFHPAAASSVALGAMVASSTKNFTIFTTTNLANLSAKKFNYFCGGMY